MPWLNITILSTLNPYSVDLGLKVNESCNRGDIVRIVGFKIM